MRSLAGADPRDLPGIDEIDDPSFGRGFVDELCRLQDEQVPLLRGVVEGSRRQAADFQVAPLDSLLELIQNADDAGASSLRFVLTSQEKLNIHHDGHPLTGPDIVGIALPTVTTKSRDADAIGRFGIGLKTVFALAARISVRDSRYAVRTTIDGAAPWTPAPDDETHIELDLRAPLTTAALEDWFNALGGDGFIFTRHLRHITVEDAEGIRAEHRLNRTSSRPIRLPGIDAQASTERVLFWTIYRAPFEVPEGFERDRKARRREVVVSVAIGPPHAHGRLFLGLPTDHQWQAPVSYDAPFDPDATRRTIKENETNDWLLHRLADLLASVVEHRWRARPASVWAAVPRPGEITVQRPWLQDRLARISDKASTVLLSSKPPGIENDLHTVVWPHAGIESVLDDEALEVLSPSRYLPRNCRDGTGRWRDVMFAWDAGSAATPNDVVRLTSQDDEVLQKPVRWFVGAAGSLLKAEKTLIENARVLVDEHGDRHTVREARSGVVLVEQSPEHRFPVLRRIHEAFLAPNETAVSVRTWLEEQDILVKAPDDERLLQALAGRELEQPIHLDDDDLRWLRSALHHVAEDQREALAERIGQRILLDGFHYDEEGQREETSVRPRRTCPRASIGPLRGSGKPRARRQTSRGSTAGTAMSSGAIGTRPGSRYPPPWRSSSPWAPLRRRASLPRPSTSTGEPAHGTTSGPFRQRP